MLFAREVQLTMRAAGTRSDKARYTDGNLQGSAMTNGQSTKDERKANAECRLPSADIHEAVRGVLLGSAVGDALALPFEGMSAWRRKRMFGPVNGHRFLFGHGMFSDDTEHACMVAQCLLRSDGTPGSFERHFARSLRWWLLALPAGIGKATLRACVKLLLGFPPARSGVRSAGNGPAMRSAVLGVLFGSNESLLGDFVRVSTRITHTDPLAEEGALLVAQAARCLCESAELPGDDSGMTPYSPQFVGAIESLRNSLAANQCTTDFSRDLGSRRGVSGFIVPTVAVALHAALSAKDYRGAILATVECGGDTDTVAAIAGALAGIRFGADSIPKDWIDGIVDYPLSPDRIELIAARLADRFSGKNAAAGPVRIPRLPVLLRNLFFLTLVLLHGFRRMLPPY